MKYQVMVAVLIGVSGLTTAWGRPAEYVCPRAGGPITIDGALDEAAWKAADTIDGFMTLGPAGETVKNKTRIRLLFDDKFLYVGGDLTTRPDKMPRTNKEASRDKGVWGSDLVDIFLRPSEGEPVTYQFMVSADGQIYDAKITRRNPNPEHWNSKLSAKTRQRMGGWTLEMAIPFSDLGPKPVRGEVWVVRIGLAADGYPLAMWPQNRELAFNNKLCQGFLIFEDGNMLTAGDFETPPSKGEQAPPGWRFALNPGDGTIGVTTLPDAPRGPHVVEIAKADEVAVYPALLFENISVEPGATYEFSAFVRAEQPFHAGVSFTGPPTEDRRQQQVVVGERLYSPSPEFQKIVARYRADEGIVQAAVVVRYQRGRGKLWVDGVSFTRVNGLARAGEAAKPADPIHNLVELSLRTRFKPFWRLKQPDGWYRNERTIFKDSGTGATIWKMSRHPGYMCRQEYMEVSPWNANGERLCLISVPQWWRILMKPDGSAWKPPNATYYSSIWDRLDPNILWVGEGSGSRRLVKYNVATGDESEIKVFDGVIALWIMSRDGKYLLAKQNLTAGGKTTSRLLWIPRDVTAGGAGIITVDPGALIHQFWFTNRPDYSVVFGYEDYLRGGAVMTPDGKVVKELPYGGGVLPGGHAAPSPSGKWAVAENFVRDWLTGEAVWISDHVTNHQSWGPDDGWFAGSCGFDLRRFGLPPRHFDQLLGSANSMMKYSVYAAEEHPVISPDGTKLGYASNMLGYIDFYCLAMRLPEAPLDPRATVDEAGVRLDWRAPVHANEIALYRVHRAASMTGPYEPVGSVPAGPTTFTYPSDREGYFVVTAQEHSGLESYYSSPAMAGRPGGPFLACVEAESGAYDAPGEETFDPGASNLYAVALGKTAPCGGLALEVPVCRKVKCVVFARVRNILPNGVPRMDAQVDGKEIGTVAVKEKAWHWLKLSEGDPIAVEAASATVKLVPLEPGIIVDQVVLVDDPKSVPDPFWGKDHRAPGPVTRLVGETADSYTIRLKWAAPADKDIAYYNVYAGRGAECIPGNPTLISSATRTDIVDWGLMAGTSYTYRITAVDRAGNEGAACGPRTVATPAVKDRVFIRQPCALRTKGEARLNVSFKIDAPAEVYLWVKARGFNQSPVWRFKVLLDDKEWCPPCQFPTGYITPHHPGPASDVWFWSSITNSFDKNEDGVRLLLPVPAGGHALSLVPDTEFNKRYGNIDVEFGEIVITNDLGYTPPGITNYLIDPMRGRQSP